MHRALIAPSLKIGARLTCVIDAVCGEHDLDKRRQDTAPLLHFVAGVEGRPDCAFGTPQITGSQERESESRLGCVPEPADEWLDSRLLS